VYAEGGGLCQGRATEEAEFRNTVGALSVEAEVKGVDPDLAEMPGEPGLGAEEGRVDAAL
jgi:hypothetical protein